MALVATGAALKIHFIAVSPMESIHMKRWTFIKILGVGALTNANCRIEPAGINGGRLLRERRTFTAD